MAGVKAGPVIDPEIDPATVAVEIEIGGYVCAAEPVAFHEQLTVTTLKVRNTGDRPIQVGSHFHFFEVNRALEFDRPAAFGQHLNIPASTALRFEPGDEREIDLVPYCGKREVYGLNNLVDGPTAGELAAPKKAAAVTAASQRGFRSASASGGAGSNPAAPKEV